MAEIFSFPSDPASFQEPDHVDQTAADRFLLEEGLELLADFRSIPDQDVRISLRALVKSMACQNRRLTS